MIDTGNNPFKSGESSSSLTKRFLRHLSVPIAKKLKHTKVTPNMVTYFSIFLGITSAVLYALSGQIYNILASVILFLSVELDYVDGSLARIKGMTSNFGYWLDKLGDMFTLIFLFIGITIGVYSIRKDYLVWLFGMMSITAVFMVRYMYLSLQYKLHNAESIFSEQKRKRKIIREFFFNEQFIFMSMILAGLFNVMYYYLIFSAIYGWIFTLVMFYMLSKKIYNED
jgi:phosphatidylglycerophosphate synthase|tara:strand:+ start:234 stop:911 length:678 start_codon:yes stop_codon:yes gene_type:complete